jgi:hypothetical protein
LGEPGIRTKNLKVELSWVGHISFSPVRLGFDILLKGVLLHNLGVCISGPSSWQEFELSRPLRSAKLQYQVSTDSAATFHILLMSTGSL